MKSVQKFNSAYTNKNVKLTPWSRALSEAFYGTRSFITDCTIAHHLPLFLRRTKGPVQLRDLVKYFETP